MFSTLRLLLKYTNAVVVALALFFAGLSYSFYQQSQRAKAAAKIINDSNAVLVRQLQQERAAVAKLTELRQQLQSQIRLRDARLNDALRDPLIAESATVPLSPLIQHALSELRLSEYRDE